MPWLGRMGIVHTLSEELRIKASEPEIREGRLAVQADATTCIFVV